MIALEFTRPLALALLVLVVAFYWIDRIGFRAPSPGRRYAALATRCLAVTLIVLALAGPEIRTSTDTLSTVFLVDRSASVPAAQQQQAISWIEQALKNKRPSDQAAVISFARDAAVDQGMSASTAVGPLTARLDQSQTDIAGALRLAQGVLPQSGARRIVLLSDGNETTGNARGETETLRAAGIPVDVVPLVASTGPEVALKSVSLPPAIHRGEHFTMNVTVSSTVETAARLRISIDGRFDSTQNVQLHTGDNSLLIGHDAVSPGEHTFQVIVEPDRDTLSENNVGYATLQVAGPPRILLVENAPGDAKYLAPALQADGLTIDVEAPSILSGDIASLRQYDAIGLINVPSTKLSLASMSALQSYVRDFGGGLIAIGGDQSFGVGSYRKTPLEETLPVSMDVKGRATHASVVLELVIDVSGSMSEGPPGATKIELAREAATGATEQLSDQDQVGILAFDDSNHWIFPAQSLTDRATLQADIAKLIPGGGTEIFPALQAAYDDIIQHQGKIKHILLMTDGLAPTGDYEGLTTLMRQNGVTLSTIAIGTDADANLLQNLADWGRGRYYDASDPIDVPRFVLQETTQVARAAITEETFTPTLLDQTPMTDGMTSVPPLLGYVATTAKPSAVVGLVSPEKDPILAQWQYGLGRSVAFTSDVAARWSAAWVSWSDFSQFWGRVFRWTVPSPQGQNLQIQTSVAGSRAQVVVDAVAADGTYVNDAPTTMTVAGPRAAPPPASASNAGTSAAGTVGIGTSQTGVAAPAPTPITLVQTAPGRYEGDVPADQQGSYVVQVSQTAPGQSAPATQSYGFTVPYSPEFSGQPTDFGTLRDLASGTGGVVQTNPAESFAHNLRLADSARPIWPYLIAALVPLFLLDVALRRLRFRLADLQPVVNRLRERWLSTSDHAARLAAHRATQLAAARVATKATPRPIHHPTPAPVRRPPPMVARPVPAPAGPAAAGGPASSRLLSAKRRATPVPRPVRR